jgi:hypothetical protein
MRKPKAHDVDAEQSKRFIETARELVRRRVQMIQVAADPARPEPRQYAGMQCCTLRPW